MSFSKLSSGIVNSSIWEEDDHVVRVWIAFLAKKDENGYVETSYNGMKRVCNIKNDPDGLKFDDAINILESPDNDSKTKDHEGRRIERIIGGWIVLNHHLYRLKEEEIREQTRERVRRHRDKNKDVTQCNVTCALPSVSVSVSECVSELNNKEKNKPLWKNKSEDGYQEYLKISEPEFDRLYEDWNWIEEMRGYYPGANIRKTIEKMWYQFWGTKAGWENKRSKKTETMDWKSTIQNNFKKSIVYWGKLEKDVEGDYIAKMIADKRFRFTS